MAERMTFDDLATMAYEAMDGIDEEQLLKVLPVLVPGIEIKWNEEADRYDVTIPDDDWDE